MAEIDKNQLDEMPDPSLEAQECQEDALSKATDELNKQKDMYLRMLAEYDNYRKRSALDQERAKVNGITAILTAILPVIDSINRAVEMLGEDDTALAGILAIKQQFETALDKVGVEQIKSIGEEFNPEVHNAIMQEENPESAGKITQVFQEGYRYKEYIIRPAMVKVAM